MNGATHLVFELHSNGGKGTVVCVVCCSIFEHPSRAGGADIANAADAACLAKIPHPRSNANVG